MTKKVVKKKTKKFLGFGLWLVGWLVELCQKYSNDVKNRISLTYCFNHSFCLKENVI